MNIIRQLDDGDWIVLAKPKRRIKVMDKLIFSDKDQVSADVIGFEDEHIKIRFNQNKDILSWIGSNGNYHFHLTLQLNEILELRIVNLIKQFMLSTLGLQQHQLLVCILQKNY